MLKQIFALSTIFFFLLVSQSFSSMHDLEVMPIAKDKLMIKVMGAVYEDKVCYHIDGTHMAYINDLSQNLENNEWALLENVPGLEFGNTYLLGLYMRDDDDPHEDADGIEKIFKHNYFNSISSLTIGEEFDAVLFDQYLSHGQSWLSNDNIFSNYFSFDGTQNEFTFYIKHKFLSDGAKLHLNVFLYTEKNGKYVTFYNGNLPPDDYSNHVDAGTIISGDDTWQITPFPKFLDQWNWGTDNTVAAIIRDNDIKYARLSACMTSTSTDSRAGIEFISVKEGVDDTDFNNAYNMSKSFSDAMGRADQSIAIQASPTKQDIITPVEYDEQGRQAKSFLPYTAVSLNGAYHENALDNSVYANSDQYKFYQVADDKITNDTHPYSETIMENSPMNRIIEQGAAGTAWQPVGEGDYTGHTIKTWTSTNKDTDTFKAVKFDEDGNFSYSDPYYRKNELLIVKTVDENGSSSWEYKDKSERTILKKSSYDGINYMYTYYVYDEYGNLRSIIPPKAIGDHSGTSYDRTLVTEFTYDGLNRLIEKKIPEAETIYTVYDKLGRAVLTQDGNSRENNEWFFTKFDVHGRAIITGIYSPVGATVSRETMQGDLDNETEFYESRTYLEADDGYSNIAFPRDNFEIHSVTYYDDYNFDIDFETTGVDPPAYEVDAEYDATLKFERLRGKVTGSKVKVLGSNTGSSVLWQGPYNSPLPTDTSVDYYIIGSSVTLSPGFETQPGQTVYIGPNVTPPPGTTPAGVENEWLTSVSFYDKYGRVIHSRSTDHLGGETKSWSEYDFSGKVLNTKSIHSTSYETVTQRQEFEYDHAGRVTKVWHKTNDTPEFVMVENVYNELGQLITKKLHDKQFDNNDDTYIQDVDYSYNIRGWLTQINDPDNLGTTDKFAMRLHYEDGLDLGQGSGTEQFNGNISGQEWRTTHNAGPKMAYAYNYDNINQLTDAKYSDYNSGWDNSDSYSIDNLSYDLNGNIKSLSRNSEGAVLDYLRYEYDGNKLIAVDDESDNPESFNDNGHKYFTGAPPEVEYGYDLNGNMTTDLNKGITNAIKYNHLNLPTEIDFGGGNKIVWTYSAGGAKLRKTVYTNNVITLEKDYIGGYVYRKNNSDPKDLEFYTTSEGRASKNSQDYTYKYDLKDHLGNVRVTFQYNWDSYGTPPTISEFAEVEQVTDYYPFGLQIKRLVPSDENKFTYNGKEYQDEFGLNWYHYGARYYDPQLGRWHVRDKFDEYHSAYVFIGNDPINAIDRDGHGVWMKVVKVGKALYKGGSMAEAFAGNIEDGLTVLNSNADTGDRWIAGLMLASELLPISGDDGRSLWKWGKKLFQSKKNVKVASSVADKISGSFKKIDNFGDAKGKSGVYVITTKDGDVYVGQSKNMGKRFKQHTSGKNPKFDVEDIDSIDILEVKGDDPRVREVVEQSVLNNLGGKDATNVINVKNPVIESDWGKHDIE